MKRRIIAATMILVIIACAIFWSATSERRNANQIVNAIEEYRENHRSLPNPDDHEVMKSLGFELRVGWYPDYVADEQGFYEITLLGGFDGPYWIYHSRTKTWIEGYPTIRTSIQ